MPVRIERRPPLRLATLDTGARNVLGLEAVEALRDALAFDAEAPVLVLSGRAEAYCAGLDTATLGASAFRREQLLAAMGELLLAALESSTRLVAACRGHAVAAGAMLLLVADHRIGARGDYKVGFTEPRLGMALPELPALLARERLDRRRVHALTALGRTVGPEEALAAGFFDSLVAPEEVMTEAESAGRDLAALSAEAYRGSADAVWRPVLARLRTLVAEQARRRDEATPD